MVKEGKPVVDSETGLGWAGLGTAGKNVKGFAGSQRWVGLEFFVCFASAFMMLSYPFGDVNSTAMADQPRRLLIPGR